MRPNQWRRPRDAFLKCTTSVSTRFILSQRSHLHPLSVVTLLLSSSSLSSASPPLAVSIQLISCSHQTASLLAAFHMEIHFLWILKETFQLWPGRLNLGMEKREGGGHPGWHHWRIWILTVAFNVSLPVKSVHLFQRALGFNSPQKTKHLQN